MLLDRSYFLLSHLRDDIVLIWLRERDHGLCLGYIRMGAVSRDSVPVGGSFLRPKFLLLRALGVLTVQPHHAYTKTLAYVVKKQGPSVGGPHLLGSQDPKYHSRTRQCQKSSPLENSIPSYNKCWRLQHELRMALCFILLVDKNKTPLWTLQQRKKRITAQAEE